MILNLYSDYMPIRYVENLIFHGFQRQIKRLFNKFLLKKLFGLNNIDKAFEKT